MYPIILYLHSYTRWIVVIVMLYALYQVWHGLITKREWTANDTKIVRIFVWAITIQFVFGVILYLYPSGLAQTAIQVISQDFATAMKTRDIRFFGMEHTLQMLIALTVVHIGAARARKLSPSAKQFRWAVISFTLALLLILSGIPWWRPLLRM